MSVKNIQINDITAPLQVCTWEQEPGTWIRDQIEYSTMNPSMANTIFKRIVNEKIPLAKNLISKAGFKIGEAHLALPIKTAFFIFVDELVEHYQNQMEQRDEQLDQDYIKLKELLAKKHAQIWSNDQSEVLEFVNLLKTKLKLVDAVPPNFDDQLAKWSEVLNIQYVANMTFIALFLPDNYIKAQHRFPTSELSFQDKFLIRHIPRGSALQTFDLILNQLSKDLSWVIPKMIEKLPPLNNGKLEEDFFKFTTMDKHLALLKNQKNGLFVSSLIPRYADEMKDILNQLYSINIHDNDQIATLLGRIGAAMEIVCHSSLKLEQIIKTLSNNKKQAFCKSGVTINSSHDLFPHLISYTEASHLKSKYLDIPLTNLTWILNAIINSNVYWHEYESEGKTPTLGIPFLIIPEGEDKKSEDALLAELEEKPKGKKPGNHRGKKKTNSYEKAGHKAPAQSAKTPSKPAAPAASISTTSTPATKENQTTTTTTTTSTSTTVVAPPATAVTQPSVTNTTTTAPTSTSTAPSSSSSSSAAAVLPPRPIQILRQKLSELYSKNPSSSLRQAMWHLDHLIVIQGSLAQSALTTPEHLCLMASVTNYAQKTLEQTYRFSLKQEQDSFTTTHNLKTYHKQLDPHSTNYPSVVNDLFLANDWHRYFYNQHKKWTAHTTFHVNIPPILEKLYKIAEGQPYSAAELNKTVEEMIKNTSKHVETLLNQTDVPANELSPRKEVQWVKTAIQEQKFTWVQQTLENFLKNVNASHPIYSSAKQAVASLKILEASIQQMNKANDIREFSTWTVGSLLQVQESMENVFHCIEYFKKGKISAQHELKTFAEQLGIDMGALGEQTHQLSYKVRYPHEIKNTSLSAQIIDDLEALKEFPDLEKGFKLQTTPKILWAHPSPDISQGKIVEKMQNLLIDTEKFLREKAVPALQEARQEHLLALAAKAAAKAPQLPPSSKNSTN